MGECVKKSVFTERAPAPVGPYSQAVVSGGLVFASGQLGMRPGERPEGSVEEQARIALENLDYVLRAAGSGMDCVLKVTVFLRSMNDFQAVNSIYGEFFREPYPARAAFEVSRLPLDAAVEIEAVARLKES
ncbi:MAG TPA: RidA family protein [Candidatus Sabulitectum sp.]|nr:RidA family protein [Candidatus Sabulitectum sp.]HPF32896.1 RidA family protein [Candidatus Sabulitectum sp.]HPJ27981.1 RidA family protein [Candidatus Sabulitectum sp.]HPR21784.1 RidA family protein [Candidatus Sabulitectum sp.]HRW78497.1 RidA family protein [Candidatus Sabulitectum sp.]